MELKAFKYLLIAVFSIFLQQVKAQEDVEKDLKKNEKNLKKMELKLKDLDVKLEKKLKEMELEKKLDDLKLEGLDKLEHLDLAIANLDLERAFDDLGKNFADVFKDFRPGSPPEPDITAQTTEKSKTITKQYVVSAKDKLALDNQYGTVTINTWDKNEIKVEVKIFAFEESDSDAQELLDGVKIIESKQNGVISLKTSIERGKTAWWGTKKKDGREVRRGVQVNYQVFMPTKNPLDIVNKYGNTVIPNFEGVLNLNSSYGSFKGGSLKNPANRIKVSYGSADIEDLKSGSLDISYGSLKLDKADKLTADVRYSSAKIGKLTGNADVSLKYSGGFKITEIDKSLKDLNINAAYSSVSLGFEPTVNFDFDVTANYGGFKYDDDKVNLTSKSPDDNARGFNPSKNFKGSYGKGSDTKIIIRANYGSVQFL